MSDRDSSEVSVTYKRKADGSIEYSAAGTLDPRYAANYLPVSVTSTVSFSAPLIACPQNLPNEFYKELIKEINNAYSNQLYTSTYMCLRKLFENLIIELLRKKFGAGPNALNLYYWADKGRFADFSVLIENLENEVAEYHAYTTSFDQTFFDFLKKFKDAANANTHSIDIYSDSKAIEEMKDKINHYLKLFCCVIDKI